MPRPRKTRTTSTAIDTYAHQATRPNIPTEELRDFVAEEEAAPGRMLYARDPSLDPQLVWKGKDEQDAADLEVPVVPIYIQEKVHPQAVIEDLRRQGTTASGGEDAPQLSLFDDFDGLEEFDAKIEFYRHAANWSNRLILGDSLLVMTSLAEKEGLKGKVQTVYLDPPYGIKFGSNWQVSTRKRDVRDGRADDATRQPEQIRAFRDTWKLGIHSYLAYLRDRLVVARELLTETGSIFVQIGDENVHLVRNLLDEVFGAENFVASIVIRKTAGQTAQLLAGTADYIIWYAKNREAVKYRRIYQYKLDTDTIDRYDQVQLESGERRPLTLEEKHGLTAIPAGARRFQARAFTSTRPPGGFPVEFEGITYVPRSGYWKTGRDGFRRIIQACRVVSTTGGTLRYVRFAEDFPYTEVDTLWGDVYGSVQSRNDPKIYVVQTSVSVIERCILMTTDPGDLVLDPTCGSGTTAFVAEQWGRRWITIDTSRVALALARTRLMAGKFSYYLLADSPEGLAKEAEVTGTATPRFETSGDIRKGFVYKRVPHVTLKAIANNPEIDTIHARSQPKLDDERDTLNTLLSQTWKEWEVPREAATGGDGRACGVLDVATTAAGGDRRGDCPACRQRDAGGPAV